VIEYLTKKIVELFDSLTAPIWKRALELSWIGRFVVLLVLLAVILVWTRWEQAVSSIGMAGALSRVAWSGESHVPLRQSLVSAVSAAQRRIAKSLKADFDQLGGGKTHAWPAMQSAVGSHGSIQIDLKRLEKFVRDEADVHCNCWSEIPDTKPRNIAISGWIIFGLAELGIPATSKEINFLTSEQHPDGWWSVFEVNEDDPEYASTYGTAWALLALHNQLSKKLIRDSDADRASEAISKGASWLMAKREENAARWKDYPLNPSGEISDSISGLALHTLHVVAADASEIDQEWLDSLPPSPPTASEPDKRAAEIPYIWIRVRDRSPDKPEVDDFVQIKLPWMVIATVDAYPNSNVVQRAKALQWLESALQQPSVITADTQPDNWWRGELSYALQYVLQRTSTLSGKTPTGQ
jgi:hypothetical protein